MFGRFKRKPAPEGPVEFRVAIEIEASAPDVYALVDWADPRNAKVDLGHIVTPLDDQGQQFRLVMTNMPELRFDMTMIEAVPSERYAFSTAIRPKVGRLETSEEHYSFESLGDDRCKLGLTVFATFQSGINTRQFDRELAMVTTSCQRAVAKLKLHAEHGVDAVNAFDRQTGF